MGTRATIHVKEGRKTVLSIYTQYDGYPDGLGQEVVDLIGSAKILNGFSGADEAPAKFNGLQCMAAYLVGKLKGDQIGNVYITDSRDRQEYNYFISQDPDFNCLTLKITDYDNKTIYNDFMHRFSPNRCA